MAVKTKRTRTRKSGAELLDQKIEQAKQKVIKTKAAHEKAVDELQILMDKKKAIQTKELMEAIAKSDRSYDEIVRFVRGEKL